MDVPWRREFEAARDPYTARVALGLTAAAIGGPFQPLDADLTAIAGLTGVNVIYYRSAADTWSPVTIGTGLSFSGGTLSCTVSTAGFAPLASPVFTGDPQAPTPATADNDTSIATTAYVKNNLTTAAIQALLGYAEGTWTPTVTFTTPGDVNVVYSSRLGIYTKIGRLVIVQFDIITSTFTFTTSAGLFQITGLPFTAAATYRSSGAFSHVTGFKAFSAGHTYLSPRIDPSGTIVTLVELGTTDAAVAGPANFTSGTNLVIRGYAIYTT
jgi:hypothetical protein